MKIWVDNERPAPEGWIWLKTQIEIESLFSQFANSGQSIVAQNGEFAIEQITHLSLDGELDPGCGSGLGIVKFVAMEAKRWCDSIKNAANPIKGIEFKGCEPICLLVHTSSESLAVEMEAWVNHAHQFWTKGLIRLSVISLAKSTTTSKE